MPRPKKTDEKQEALANLVSGGGEEASDTTEAEAGSTAEDTEIIAGDQEQTESQEQNTEGEGATEDKREPESDAKAEALANLVSGGAGAQKTTAPVPSRPAVKTTGKTVKMGTGKSRALVAADVYSGEDAEGLPIIARKGDTVVLSSEKVDRGVRLGLLQKV